MRESALLHLQWSFVNKLQIDKFHPEMYIFDLIENHKTSKVGI